jgi:hypothetical protein
VGSEPTKYWHPSKRGGTSLLPRGFSRRFKLQMVQSFSLAVPRLSLTVGDVEFERPVFREWRDSMSKNRFIFMLDNLHHDGQRSASVQPALLSMLGMPQDEGEAGSMARLPSRLTGRVPLNSSPCRSQRRKRPRANTDPHRCGISWE